MSTKEIKLLQQIYWHFLGEYFPPIQGVSGAAILGDGQVGLVIDLMGLMERSRTELKVAS